MKICNKIIDLVVTRTALDFEYRKFSYKDKIKFLNSLNKGVWKNISGFYGCLFEDFIREFQYKVHWWNISCDQKLSEDFIREFQDKISWSLVSLKQKLSEDFIEEFKDKVDWYYIISYQELSEEFKDRFFRYRTAYPR